MVGRGAEPANRDLPRFGEAGPDFVGPADLDGYRVYDKIASGSFSRVYRAFDPNLQRPAAIKVFRLHPEDAADLPYDIDDWRRRFVAEARFLAGFDHPHVVRVDHLGWVDPDTPYMVMPWHPANLRKLVGRDVFDPDRLDDLPEAERPRAVPAKRALEILRQICLGLAALHRQGIVHRDVKPSNILLTNVHDGIVRICDFGMMRRCAATRANGANGANGGGRSRGGVWIGTADYIAPEQRESADRAGERADVFSLGILAYRTLTGRMPTGAFAPASEIAPDVEKWIDQWIADALAPDPEKRPPAIALAARIAASGGWTGRA